MYLRQRYNDAVCVWRQWPLYHWRNEIFGFRLTKSMEKMRNGMVLWPPRSPELAPADFNLCSHLKNAVQRRRVKIRVQRWRSDWSSGCENTDICLEILCVPDPFMHSNKQGSIFKKLPWTFCTHYGAVITKYAKCDTYTRF